MDAQTNTAYQRIYNLSNLKEAWKQIKKKSKVAGIDSITLEEYEVNLMKNLENLSHRLKNHTYMPKPYLTYKMKKTNHSFREIAISTIEDRIVQKNFTYIFRDNFESFFSDSSYAYRPHRGHRKAVGKIAHLIQSREVKVVAAGDINSFFDSISQTIVLQKFEAHICDEKDILDLLQLWLKNGAVSNNKFSNKEIGIPQGYIVSPLLANLYLTEFDRQFENRETLFFRYADNFLFLSSKGIEVAQKQYEEAKLFLKEKLHLKLNKKDCQIKKIEDGFLFLGLYFNDKDIEISEKKQIKMKNSISKITTSKMNIAKISEKISAKTYAWKYYYGIIHKKTVIFEEIDRYIINAIAKRISFMELSESRTHAYFKDLETMTNLSAHKTTKDLQTAVNILENKPTNVESKIREQRKTYKQLTHFDGEVVIIRPGSRLLLRNNKLLLELPNRKKHAINLSTLKYLQISSKSNTITTNVIEKMAEHKIPIYITDNFGNPISHILPASFFSLNKSRTQLEAFYNGKAAILAKEFVYGKIHNRVNMIKYFGKSRKDFQLFQNKSGEYIENEKIIKTKIDELETTNMGKLQDRLLGYEGSASVKFWELFRLLTNRESFKREHKGSRESVNIMLNYGYGILYHRIFTAVVRSHLNPGISYLHREQQNKPVLVFDLIEQFRAPLVERTVISLLNRGFSCKTDSKNRLTPESKQIIASAFLKRLHTFINRGKSETSISEQIPKKVKRLVDFLSGQSSSYRCYSMRW